MSSCLLSGLPDDPLVDAEVWRYNLVLGIPAQANTPAQPFDLTGSDMTIVMRALSWEIVATLSTVAQWPNLDGTITITDPTAGAVSIVSDPWRRSYRVRVPINGGIIIPTTVRGDVLRLAQGDPTARPEYLGYIQFPLRASTTQWPAPTS
jgi:hypothetical protein